MKDAYNKLRFSYILPYIPKYNNSQLNRKSSQLRDNVTQVYCYNKVKFSSLGKKILSKHDGLKFNRPAPIQSKIPYKIVPIKDEGKKHRCCCHKEHETIIPKHPFLKKKQYDQLLSKTVAISNENTSVKESVIENMSTLPMIAVRMVTPKEEAKESLVAVLPLITPVKVKLTSEERIQLWKTLMFTLSRK